MYLNARVARSAWLESAWANCLHGLFRDQLRAPMVLADRFVPRTLLSTTMGPVLDRDFVTRALRRRHFADHPRSASELTSGWGSLAKVVGSDRAIANADLAIDLMGAAGTRHDLGAEKLLRDAKLLQIYEGTNQLNRLNVFKCHIGQSWPDVDAFAEGAS
jgi:alkylation response protein AidB-like acyl-CoA dehydrogenase